MQQVSQVAWHLAAKRLPELAWLSVICGQSALEWGIVSSATAIQWIKNVSQLNQLLKEKYEAEHTSNLQASLLEALRMEKEAKERQLQFERDKYLQLHHSRGSGNGFAEAQAEIDRLLSEQQLLQQREREQSTRAQEAQLLVERKELQILEERQRVEVTSRAAEEQYELRLSQIESAERAKIQELRERLEFESQERMQKEAQLDELRRTAGDAHDTRRQLKEKERELEEERKRMQETSRGLERQLQQAASASRLENALELELECSICTENFTEACTLQCSHSFCKECIDDWIQKRKSAGQPALCPICNFEITREPVRTIQLDNVVRRLRSAEQRASLQ